MKQIFVRFAEERDAERFDAWVKLAQEINLFDAAVMKYPTTKTLVAEIPENGQPADELLYMPYQTALMMESLAPKPGIEPINQALALREITKAMALLASQAGIKELYFGCKDERVVKFAEAHGWEVLQWKMLRMKVGQ